MRLILLLLLVAPCLGQSPLLLFSDESYIERVQATRPILYLPISERTGTVARNYGTLGIAANGSYTGVTLGAPGIGDGLTSGYWDGVNDHLNILSTPLANSFSPQAGSVMCWFRAVPTIWTDGVYNYILEIGDGNNNRIIVCNTDSDGYLSVRYHANGVTKTKSIGGLTGVTNWMCYVATWDKSSDQLTAYLQGVRSGGPVNGLGEWSGLITRAIVGAYSTVPQGVWAGNLAHFALWNYVLSPALIRSLAKPQSAWLQPDLLPWLPALRADWTREVDEAYRDVIPPFAQPVRKEWVN